MRKLAGAIFAIVLMTTAAGVWSSLGTAAGLVGAYDRALVDEPSAAAQVADRFPRETERLRAFAFIRPPEAIDPADATRRHGRQQVMAPGCGPSAWPFVADFVAKLSDRRGEAGRPQILEGCCASVRCDRADFIHWSPGSPTVRRHKGRAPAGVVRQVWQAGVGFVRSLPG